MANTDRWFYAVFQSALDLIRWLLTPPEGSRAGQSVPLDLDRHYRFSAPELKAGAHRLDGVLWPLGSDTGSPELPVVFLEVQIAPIRASVTAWRPRPSAFCSSTQPSSTGGWW